MIRKGGDNQIIGAAATDSEQTVGSYSEGAEGDRTTWLTAFTIALNGGGSITTTSGVPELVASTKGSTPSLIVRNKQLGWLGRVRRRKAGSARMKDEVNWNDLL